MPKSQTPILKMGTVVKINNRDAKIVRITRDGCWFQFLDRSNIINVSLSIVERSFA